MTPDEAEVLTWWREVILYRLERRVRWLRWEAESAARLRLLPLWRAHHEAEERRRIAEGRPVPDVVYVIGKDGEVVGTRRLGEPRSVLRPVPGRG